MKLLCSLAFTLLLPVSAKEVRSPVPQAIGESFKLDPFYQKCVLVGPFPVVASEKVLDSALLEAAHIVGAMLKGREDVLTALAENKVRLAVMATGEYTCDLPEHSDLEPRDFWNWRARGLGATPQRPAVSCGEENLIHCPGDPYATENILVHEFAHAIHQMGMNRVDPTFDKRLRESYEAAMTAGKWKDCYAADNHYEYWAEAVQSWFGTNRENDNIHNHVNTRAELKAYDPGVAALCAEVFPRNDWTYLRADDPTRGKEAHLADIDRDKLPNFKKAPEPEETSR